VSIARWLRAADTVVAWAAVCLLARLALGMQPRLAALLAAGAVAALAGVPPLRRRFRPVSGPVGLHVSRHLRPGAAAWFIHGDRAERVLVTGRRGFRLVVSLIGDDGPAEGIEVRRTRVLVL
jgi:hypothetical protein